MILPAFGIVSHIISTFSRKELFGYSSMVWAMVSIAILSFVVWAHHMFTVGMPLAAELFFMWATMLIAVPIGTAISMVAHIKNSSAASGIPTVNI